MRLSIREIIFSISIVMLGGTGMCVVVCSFMGSIEFAVPYAAAGIVSAVCALLSKPHKKLF